MHVSGKQKWETLKPASGRACGGIHRTKLRAGHPPSGLRKRDQEKAPRSGSLQRVHSIQFQIELKNTDPRLAENA